MRGKAGFIPALYSVVGITPAYAGKSVSVYCHCVQLWDHPRVCGEKSDQLSGVDLQLGSPPRMRGKVNKFNEPLRRGGITPACAGKSCVNGPL